MKKIALVIIALTAMSSKSMAGVAFNLSHSSYSASKIEQAPNVLAQEAAILLVQGGEPSEELQEALIAARAKQATIFGEAAAAALSDEVLLLLIFNN